MSLLMKTRLAAAVIGACALITTGTAHATADPLAELTPNPLYKAGKLTASCAKGLTKGTTKASTTKYLTALVGCMNTAWVPRLKAAGFAPNKVAIAFGASNPCASGDEEKTKTSTVLYCRRIVHVELRSDWIKARDDLKVLPEISWAYARHITWSAGIDEAAFALPEDVAEAGEQMRRRALQVDCLNGVFLKGVWTAQKRTSSAWKALVSGVKKDEMSKLGWFGKAGSRVYWLNAGFATANPASCNTWKAPSAKVA